MFVPVLLAGGSGSRLWPTSRQLYPKQFLNLISPESSMLQDTLKRLDGLSHLDPLVICNEEHRFLAAEQLRQLDARETLILEPAGRNTGPATALAALRVMSITDDAVLLVLPADHAIEDVAALQRSLLEAELAAENGALVTFGVTPTYAETGYGYIQKGRSRANGGFEVTGFREKPDAATAEALIATGDFLWNSGMFMFKASVYLKELRQFAPEIVTACQHALEGLQYDMDFIRVDPEPFLECSAASVDVAVMENTTNAAVICLDAGWSDVGSWSALMDFGSNGRDRNVTQGDVLTDRTEGCFIRSESRLVATCAVQDLVIVETKDSVLVAHRDETQGVRAIVEALEADERVECRSHQEVYRPWGVYDLVDHGDRYQVKRITVKPGGQLSLQMHRHRAEHWVVVRGTARVRRGDDTFLVSENESTFIPVGEVHALENPGVIPLEVIEVQSGDYLHEDDIVRLEDKYGRSVE